MSKACFSRGSWILVALSSLMNVGFKTIYSGMFKTLLM